MAAGTLASAVVMGLFLIAVAVLVRSRGWYAYTPSVTAGGETGVTVGRTVDDPVWWTAGFLLLVAVFGGGAVALVSGALSPATATLLLGGAGGAVLVLFFLAGVYHAVRSRGGARARAVMVAAWVVGLVLVAAVSAKLVMG